MDVIDEARRQCVPGPERGIQIATLPASADRRRCAQAEHERGRARRHHLDQGSQRALPRGHLRGSRALVGVGSGRDGFDHLLRSRSAGMAPATSGGAVQGVGLDPVAARGPRASPAARPGPRFDACLRLRAGVSPPRRAREAGRAAVQGDPGVARGDHGGAACCASGDRGAPAGRERQDGFPRRRFGRGRHRRPPVRNALARAHRRDPARPR